MANEIVSIQGQYCGASHWLPSFELDESMLELIKVGPPLIDGTYNFILTLLEYGPFGGPALEENMVHIDIVQRAMCGFINPEVIETVHNKHLNAYQFPCWNPTFSIFQPQFVIPPADCDTGTEFDELWEKADLECPEAICTLMVPEIRVYKDPGAEPFTILFNLDISWVSAPP